MTELKEKKVVYYDYDTDTLLKNHTGWKGPLEVSVPNLLLKAVN